MKNVVVLVFVCVCALVPLAAENAIFPEPVPGEFVMYRDHTWKAPTWTGFLCYDRNTYAGLLVTPSTGTRVAILFRGEPSGDVFVLTGQKIISKNSNDDVPAINYLMRLVEDLYRWRIAAQKNGVPESAPSRSRLLPPRVVSEITAHMFGGEVRLVHAAEIPVFALHSVDTTDGKRLLDLERSGMIRSGSDADFFGFEPGAEEKEGKKVALKRNPAGKEFLVDGRTLLLDEQWAAVAENTFFLGDSAMLVIDTLDTESAGIPADGLPLYLLRFFSRSTRNVWADPDKSVVSGTEHVYKIENVFFDADTGLYNHDFKVCIPSEDKRTVLVMSLTVGEGSYQKNRAYFDALLSSLSK